MTETATSTHITRKLYPPLPFSPLPFFPFLFPSFQPQQLQITQQWKPRGVNRVNCYSTYTGFPSASEGQESACNAEDSGSVPGSGRSHGEGNDNPFQYSCLENTMDRRVWHATVYRVITTEQLTTFTYIQTYKPSENSVLQCYCSPVVKNRK